MALYTIPLSKSFTDVLAQHILDEYGKDTHQLARLLVLLPSRRACTALKEALFRANHEKPMLMPRIAPIGEVDEEELYIETLLTSAALSERYSTLLPAISRYRRQFMLAEQIAAFGKATRTLPLNMEQALRLAAELAHFMDEVDREELSYTALQGLVPEEYAAHWQEVLQFLSIVTEYWPQILREQQVMNPVARRSALIRLLAESWRQRAPEFPVIAAGTTGSIPATAELLKTIAALPQGSVILPGIDITLLPKTHWEHIADIHPLSGIRQLLARCGLEIEDVGVLGSAVGGQDSGFGIQESVDESSSLATYHLPHTTSSERITLLFEVMAPAEEVVRWKQHGIDMAEAVRGVHTLTLDSSHEEALAIALAVRDTLAQPEKTVAVVTHDRTLARQVVSLLKRFAITADDSAGEPLMQTPACVFMRLVAQAVSSRMDPVSLLAVLKHPLCSMGKDRAELLSLARNLEREVLRGVRIKPELASVIHATGMQLGEDSEEAALLRQMEEMLSAFTAVMQQREAPLSSLFLAHKAAAERLAGDNLYRSDSGQQLREILEELAEAVDGRLAVDPTLYAGIWETMLSTQEYRRPYGAHPRVHILSPMEMRLQRYDKVIMAGLNEGSWPPAPTADAWMSRPMRAQFGLTSPERAIGQAAHDFLMIATTGEVLLTRARKVNGKPTIPSRWLLKLEALLEKVNIEDTRLHYWVKQYHAVGERMVLLPPAPIPPLAARPRRLSVTAIERLMRDPYGVYASHILRLKKLKPLDQELEAKDFGILLHGILECFSALCPDRIDEKADALLRELGRKAFEDIMDRPSVYSFWWPQFETIASWFIEFERDRRQQGVRVHTEVEGSIVLAAPYGAFTLTAQMDRVEVHPERVAILDYKTSTARISKTLAQEGYLPQLPLEALIAEKGNISLDNKALPVGELTYVFLKSKLYNKRFMSLGEDNKYPLRQYIEETEAGVKRLIAYFDQATSAYFACPREDRKPPYNDYEHLERIKEWSLHQ